MAKVYESKAGSRGISTAHGHIKFQRDSVTGFGVLRSDNALLLKKLRLTAEQVEQKIEEQAEFKNAIPGERGIWLEEARIDRQADQRFVTIRQDLESLGEAVLRRKLAKAKVPAPVNATVAELADLVLQAMAAGKTSSAGDNAPEPAADTNAAPSVKPPKSNLRRGTVSATPGE